MKTKSYAFVNKALQRQHRTVRDILWEIHRAVHMTFQMTDMAENMELTRQDIPAEEHCRLGSEWAAQRIRLIAFVRSLKQEMQTADDYDPHLAGTAAEMIRIAVADLDRVKAAFDAASANIKTGNSIEL